jgi:hypothetical protein
MPRVKSKLGSYFARIAELACSETYLAFIHRSVDDAHIGKAFAIGCLYVERYYCALSCRVSKNDFRISVNPTSIQTSFPHKRSYALRFFPSDLAHKEASASVTAFGAMVLQKGNVQSSNILCRCLVFTLNLNHGLLSSTVTISTVQPLEYFLSHSKIWLELRRTTNCLD